VNSLRDIRQLMEGSLSFVHGLLAQMIPVFPII
jgi:hypothetical protein